MYSWPLALGESERLKKKKKHLSDLSAAFRKMEIGEDHSEPLEAGGALD